MCLFSLWLTAAYYLINLMDSKIQIYFCFFLGIENKWFSISSGLFDLLFAMFNEFYSIMLDCWGYFGPPTYSNQNQMSLMDIPRLYTEYSFEIILLSELKALLAYRFNLPRKWLFGIWSTTSLCLYRNVNIFLLCLLYGHEHFAHYCFDDLKELCQSWFPTT